MTKEGPMSRRSISGTSGVPRVMRTFAVVTGTLLVASMVSLIAASADTPAPARPAKPPCTLTGCVRLHLGSDSRKFTYNGVTQPLSTPQNSCKLNAPASGSIMTYSATATAAGAAPGLNGTDLGVRVNSSGNGTPCGQVDTTEALTLSPFTGTGAVIPNAKFTGLTMDLEVTGNAKVRLDLNTSPPQTYFLETGTSIESAETSESGYSTAPPYLVTSYSNYVVGPNVYSDTVDACAAPNSSGPNSGSNDNCEWTVLANKVFTQATLSVVNGVGTASVEGSNDFGSIPTYDTQFYLDAAPTAVADNYPVNQTFATTTLNVNAPGVLSNDTDPDGPAPLTAVPETVTTSKGGSATLSANGSFTYTSAPGVTGNDTFTYQAQDGAGLTSTPATVTIAINAAPVAHDDGPYLVNQGGQALTIAAAHGLIANDTDVDGPAPITVNSVVQPAKGSVVVNADGSFTYTSDPAFDAPSPYNTTFTYKAQDAAGAISQSATVNLTVLPVMCTNDEKSAFSVEGGVSGTFTLLSPGACKGYQLSSIDPTGGGATGTVTFLPNGSGTPNFRGDVNLGPITPVDGQATGTLRYDPSGGNNLVPVPWCHDSVFDADGDVTSATIPQINAGITDTWCIAKVSELQSTDANNVSTVTPIWQVFGHDDPKFG
jgi:hypothetical protein